MKTSKLAVISLLASFLLSGASYAASGWAYGSVETIDDRATPWDSILGSSDHFWTNNGTVPLEQAEVRLYIKCQSGNVYRFWDSTSSSGFR